VVLIGTAVAIVSEGGLATIWNTTPAVHGFSEVLYAFSSAGNNNGSHLLGWARTRCFTTRRSASLCGWRAIGWSSGSGNCRIAGAQEGCSGWCRDAADAYAAFHRHSNRVVIIVGALTFFPALALGPIAEHFMALGL